MRGNITHTRVSYRIFWWGVEGGKKFVGHCHSVIHEYETIRFKYETIQIFKGVGGEFQAPLGMKPHLLVVLHLLTGRSWHPISSHEGLHFTTQLYVWGK